MQYCTPLQLFIIGCLVLVFCLVESNPTVVFEISYTSTLLRLDSRKISPKGAKPFWITAFKFRQNCSGNDTCVTVIVL